MKDEPKYIDRYDVVEEILTDNGKVTDNDGLCLTRFKAMFFKYKDGRYEYRVDGDVYIMVGDDDDNRKYYTFEVKLEDGKWILTEWEENE